MLFGWLECHKSGQPISVSFAYSSNPLYSCRPMPQGSYIFCLWNQCFKTSKKLTVPWSCNKLRLHLTVNLRFCCQNVALPLLLMPLMFCHWCDVSDADDDHHHHVNIRWWYWWFEWSTFWNVLHHVLEISFIILLYNTMPYKGVPYIERYNGMQIRNQ